MTKIKLHGILAKKFSKCFEFENITKIVTAISAIDSRKDGFRNFLFNQVGQGKNFEFIVNGETLKNKEDCLRTRTIETLDIVPCIGGSGAFIAQLFFNIFKSAAIAATSGYQILITVPQGMEAGFAGPSEDSFLFTSMSNTASQGSSVPIGYGLLRVGSKIISINTDTYDGSTFDYQNVSSEFSAGGSAQQGGGGSY